MALINWLLTWTGGMPRCWHSQEAIALLECTLDSQAPAVDPPRAIILPCIKETLLSHISGVIPLAAELRPAPCCTLTICRLPDGASSCCDTISGPSIAQYLSPRQKKGPKCTRAFQIQQQQMIQQCAECLAIEDAPSGVEAATAAGMRVVAVPSLPDEDAYTAAARGCKEGWLLLQMVPGSCGVASPLSSSLQAGSRCCHHCWTSAPRRLACRPLRTPCTASCRLSPPGCCGAASSRALAAAAASSASPPPTSTTPPSRPAFAMMLESCCWKLSDSSCALALVARVLPLCVKLS